MGSFTNKITTRKETPDVMLSAFFKTLDEQLGADSFLLEHEGIQIAGILCPITEEDLGVAMGWLEERVGGAEGSHLVQIHYPDTGCAGMVMARGAPSPQAMVDALKKHPTTVYTRDGQALLVSSDGAN
jgi:hypothetical protein